MVAFVNLLIKKMRMMMMRMMMMMMMMQNYIIAYYNPQTHETTGAWSLIELASL